VPLLLAATDPQVSACGRNGQQGWLCSTVFRITHDADAAKVADSVAKPIAILFIIVVTWLVVRLVRRRIHRFAGRVRDRRPTDALGLGGVLPAPTELERRRRAQRVDTLAGEIGRAHV